MSTQTATCTVDATDLHSDCEPDSDEYIESPLNGRLILIMNQSGQHDVRSLAITKSDWITPVNLSSTVYRFVFQILGWDENSLSNDPDEHCLGDTLYNSGGGIDNWCMEGQMKKFEVDTDPDSPSFGKIITPLSKPVIPEGYDGVAVAVKTSIFDEPAVTVR